MIDGVSIFETAELHHAPTTLIESREEDYPAIQNFRDATYICCVESSKVWGIAGPIAFNILCNYGINSFTNIFVGHIGDIELSAVAISLSVIANFSFGFLVSFPSSFFNPLNTFNIRQFQALFLSHFYLQVLKQEIK